MSTTVTPVERPATTIGSPARAWAVERPTFVSIQTSSYSGATLLAFLLGAHPQIATVGEMNGLIAREDPDVYRCSCGERIRACTFWQQVEQRMQARGVPFEVASFDMAFEVGRTRLGRFLRVGALPHPALSRLRDASFEAWPPERRRLKQQVARNEALVESVLDVTGKRVFVDTSKDRLRLVALRRFSTFDVRAIHLVRDVRGVVASWLRRKRGRGARQVARRWARLHRRLDQSLATFPDDQQLFVRYEDLCRDVPGTLDELYRFCGVDPDEGLSDFRQVPQHIVGNAMRLSNVSQIRLDERWREQLTAEQLREIQAVAGNLNRRYGYV